MQPTSCSNFNTTPLGGGGQKRPGPFLRFSLNKENTLGIPKVFV